jgi:hypothetical protein
MGKKKRKSLSENILKYILHINMTAVGVMCRKRRKKYLLEMLSVVCKKGG